MVAEVCALAQRPRSPAAIASFAMEASGPDPHLVARVERALRRRVVAWRKVERGYTPARRWIATLDSGDAAFVKVATNDDTAKWLREEQRIYDAVAAPFLARRLAYEDAPTPMLVLEDLSTQRWPPPWTTGDVDLVLAALDAVHRTPPPSGLPSLADNKKDTTGWSTIEEDPTAFLSLGFADADWLEHALPALLAAEGALRFGGETLLHLDVRSDNLCFVDGRAVLVDWNWACRGNPEYELAAFLPS